LWTLVLSAVLSAAPYQTASTPDAKLALRAALVLTPGFCAAKFKSDNRVETFLVGKAACEELEPALREVFPSLTTVAAASSVEDNAQVVLLPRVVGVRTTIPGIIHDFNRREMVVLLEWTVNDRAGKTVWIETVQGSAKGHAGNGFTHNKDLKLLTNDAVKDAAQQS
jgi:hypothetical protein